MGREVSDESISFGRELLLHDCEPLGERREIASTHARIVPGKYRYVIGGIVR